MTEVYLIATLVVVIIFAVILKKVFTELDNANSFVNLPTAKEEPELKGELDDLAASEFVRNLIRLYEDFGAPDKEIALQLEALLNANSKQIQAMLANLLPKAEESIAKASSEQKAKEFYEASGEIYNRLKAS